MNLLWEVMLRAVQQGVSKGDIRFQRAKSFSPCMEVSAPCLNQEDLRELSPVEVNLYYRFYHIFKDLYRPDETEFPQLRASLTNLLLHELAENDVRSGLTRKEFYKKRLCQDFEEGLYGAESKAALALFHRDEKDVILSSLLRQYETGSSLDIFKDAVVALIPESIVYRSNDDFYEIFVYVGLPETEVYQQKLAFLQSLFLELPYHTEIYYDHHFGILGIDGTMNIGEIALV